MELSAQPRLASFARLRVDPQTQGMILLYPEGALELNPSAAAILQLCDGSRTLADIAGTLAEQFQIDASSLHSDITLCLDRLAADGLIVTLSVT